MKSKEMYEILIENGVESEKKARSILTWYEAFGFVGIIAILNIIAAIIGFNFGILNLIGGIVGVFISRKYVSSNLNNTEKLLKGHKICKISTLLIIAIIVLLIIGVIVFAVLSTQENYASNKLSGDGVKITYSIDEENFSEEDIENTKNVLANRIESLYSTDYDIKVNKKNTLNPQIIVRIQDETDADEISKTIGKMANLQFVEPMTIIEEHEHIEGEDEANYTSIVPDMGKVIMDGNDIISAKAQSGNASNSNSDFIELTISDEASIKFADATERNIGNVIFILLEDEVLMAPFVNERIETKNPIITGGYTAEEANELAELISSGALPIDLKIENAEYLSNINE